VPGGSSRAARGAGQRAAAEQSGERVQSPIIQL